MSLNHIHPQTSRVTSFTNPTFPNSRRAARSASFTSSPCSARSRAAISRWVRNSSSRSASRRLRRQKLIGHLTTSYALTSLLPYFLTSLHPLWIQHARDRLRKLRPLRTFLGQLFLSGGRQLVKLCPLLVLGDSPLRRNPFLSFQPMQCRIK